MWWAGDIVWMEKHKNWVGETIRIPCPGPGKSWWRHSQGGSMEMANEGWIWEWFWRLSSQDRTSDDLDDGGDKKDRHRGSLQASGLNHWVDGDVIYWRMGRWEEEQVGGGHVNQALSFGHVKFEMPSEYSSGTLPWSLKYYCCQLIDIPNQGSWIQMLSGARQETQNIAIQ